MSFFFFLISFWLIFQRINNNSVGDLKSIYAWINNKLKTREIQLNRYGIL